MPKVRVKLSRNIALSESAAADPSLKYFDGSYGGELYLETVAELDALPRVGDRIYSHEELIVKTVFFHLQPPESGPAIVLEVSRQPALWSEVDLEERGAEFDQSWVLHPDAEDMLHDDILSSLLCGWKLTGITTGFQTAFLRMLDDVQTDDDEEAFLGSVNMKLLRDAIRDAPSY